MELITRQIKALDDAERRLFHRDFCPYLDLKVWLSKSDKFSRDRFRELYADFYQLQPRFLTKEFLDRYFEHLFDPPKTGDVVDTRRIFEELCCIKNKQGSETLPLSFVSKLLGMHDESSPIYDIHVSSFLGLKPPGSSRPMRERINWCLDFFDNVKTDYIRWAEKEDVAIILERLKQRDRALQQCHNVRLLDFLIWKVGSKKLLSK